MRVKRVSCGFCGAKAREPCIKNEDGKAIPVPFYHHSRQVAAAEIENKRKGKEQT